MLIAHVGRTTRFAELKELMAKEHRPLGRRWRMRRNGGENIAAKMTLADCP